MSDLSSQIIQNIFPEERNKFILFLREQKRNVRNWLAVLTIAGLVILLSNLDAVVVAVVLNSQVTINWILFLYIVALCIIPSVWPQKPGDFFADDFRKGLDPQIWEAPGQGWKVELDENGKPVLTVTNSERGGLATPCLSWTDYEVRFDTRILNKCTAWIVRASSLNNYAMIQLEDKSINPHRRAAGMWIEKWIEKKPHDFTFKKGQWYSVQTILRGAWIQVWVTVDNDQHLLYQGEILGTQRPQEVHLTTYDEKAQTHEGITILDASYRIGSFGFRLSGDEKAQFRNVRAYKLSSRRWF